MNNFKKFGNLEMRSGKCAPVDLQSAGKPLQINALR